MTRSHLGQVKLAAGFVDVDADKVAFGVVVENDAVRDFDALHARPRR